MSKKTIKSIEIDSNENLLKVLINPNIYPLDVIYAASYVFIDNVYVIIEGDLKKEIRVILKPKEKYDLEKLGMEFNNELLNYAVYKEKSTKNKGIREAIMQRALVTNDPTLIEGNEDDKLDKDLDEDIEEFLDDPEGIAIPWEDKYGKEVKKKTKDKKKIKVKKKQKSTKK
jgi:His-Xaa-Ser system protein HxsD